MTHCIDCGAEVIPPLRYLCPCCAAREGIQAYEPPPLPPEKVLDLTAAPM